MSFKFDMDKIIRRVIDAAADHTHSVLEQAKDELGADGYGIEISKSPFRQSGDKLDLGKVTFPSEEVKARFLEIVRQKMR